MLGKLKLWQKVTIGLILGVIAGIILQENAIYVKFLGDLFIKLVKMIVIPLIFFSLVSGITNITDPKRLGRMGAKAFFGFLFTSAFAVTLGISVATLLEPGLNNNLVLPNSNHPPHVAHEYSIASVLMDIIPSNGIEAMANGNMVQVVFFSIFVGVTLSIISHKAKKTIVLVQEASIICFKMIDMIVQLSPLGAFGFTGWLVGTQGLAVLKPLLNLVMCISIAAFIQYVMYGIIIMIFGKLSPIPFYKKSFEYQIMAISTTSSKATLSTTMNISRERLGVSEHSVSFMLPLGAAVNMDGMAIYLSIVTLFIAQILGVHLLPYQYVIIAITATIGSIGAAGIPSGSLVLLPIILTAVNLPIEGVALVAGIDRILDMIRTTINITSDAAVTLIVDRSENNTDTDIYYS